MMESGRRYLSCLVLVCLVAGGGSPIYPEQPATSLEELVAGQIQALIDTHKISGAALAVVQGESISPFYIGTLSRKDAQPPTAHTLYEIGSITKTFTAALLALMVTAGEVTLDTTLQSLMPAAVRVPDYEGREITLGDLATHVSGLPRLPGNLQVQQNRSNPYAGYTRDDLYAFLNDYRLPRAPGATYEYSNLGVALLGEALANRAGIPYESLLTDRVLAPLGLHDTYVSRRPEMTGRFAPPQQASRLHFLGAGLVPANNWDLELFSPAGSIISSLDEMVIYLKANMNPTGTILEPVASLLRESRFAISETSAIALAWHIMDIPGTSHKVIWHNGQTGGYCSFMGFAPETSTGIAILCNAPPAGHMDQIALKILAFITEEK